MNEGLLAMGTAYQPPDMAFYKRAVLRPAPPMFTVEVLAPVKQGNSHSYGMRIIPLQSETDTLTDTRSIRSTYREYEVWRRWEDCIDFQNTLELEYDRKSREKRRILEAGKSGRKGNGVYMSSGNAASFESLPEGPDPKSVTFDIHSHIPKLNAKSSFFRASDATIQKRGQEFAALITALLAPDQATLVLELRESNLVRDFFGWWRRDKELAAKMRPHTSSGIETLSRASMTESMFTGLPSPESPRSPAKNSKPMLQSLQIPRTASMRSSTPSSDHRPHSAMGTRSETERSLPSPPISPELAARRRAKSPMYPHAEDQHQSMTFTANPPQPRDTYELAPAPSPRGPLADRAPPASPSSHLGARLGRSPMTANRGGRLFDPEEVRFGSPPSTPQRQRRSSGSANSSPASSRPSSASDTSGDSPPHTPTRLSDMDDNFTLSPPRRMRPESHISIDSRYDLDLSFLGGEPEAQEDGMPRRPRNRDSMMSVASMDSVRTACSADAIVPRARRRRSRIPPVRPPRGGPPPSDMGEVSWRDSMISIALPEEDEYDEEDGGEEFFFDDSCSYIEDIKAFPTPPLLIENIMRGRRTSMPESVCESENSWERETSPVPWTQTTSDAGHSTAHGDSLAVKVKYDDCVVAFRASLDITFDELRARLRSKFQQVQGIEFNPQFVVGYLPSYHLDADAMPIMLSPSVTARFKERPVTSMSAASLFGPVGMTRMLPIRSQNDWDAAMDSCGGKLTLHVLDSELSD